MSFFLQLLLLLLIFLLLALSLVLPLLLLTAAPAPGLTEVLGQVAAGRQEEEEEMQEGTTSTCASSSKVEKLDGSTSRGGPSGTRPTGRGRVTSRSERPKKASPPPLGSQRPLQRGLPQNRSGGAMRNPPPTHKTLQVGEKKVDGAVVGKKSVEKRLGVKESQKKPSAADKDRGSGVLVDKKDSRRLGAPVGAERRVVVQQQEQKGASTAAATSHERRQSKATDRSPALAKTEPNKEKNDNNDKSPIPPAKKVEKKWAAAEEKNGSLAGKSCPRPMVKHSSSVSLVRKKFERKVESSEGGAEPVKGKKHVTQPVPKGAISQNLFLKGDANAKKKAETTSLVGVEDPTKSREQVEEVEKEQQHEEEEEKVEEGKEVEGGVVLPSDTETVPSQHSLVDEWGASSSCVSGWVGEPVAHLSRRQTIPNLNIDDVSPHHHQNEEAEQGSNRLNLDVRLEHELPESPAYRSPLLSDSEEGEEVVSHHSSRQHVLEAYVASGSSGEETSLRNKLLSNLVNKRSESDGIVTLDRPRPEPAIR